MGIKKIHIKGPVETDITFNDLKEQAGDINLFDSIVLDISSQGGCVEEGLKIMIWLDTLSQSGKEVITVVSANAYSIASLIMLAADKRYISKHGEVMVHNPMVPFIEYANANELEKHIAELRSLENMLQQLYVNFANISVEDIKGLMDQETYLSPDEAVLKGFADAVIDIKPKPYSMMAINKQLNMSKTKNMLNIVIAAVNGSEFVNQMYYNTKGDEVQIFQANPAKYGIGDKTSMEEGEVRLSDGTMLSIVAFEITNIEKEIEQPEEVVAEEAVPEGEVKVEEEAPVVAVKEVEEVAPVAVAPIEEAAPVAEFNEGPAPKEVEEKAVAIAIVDITPEVEPVAEIAPGAPVEEVIAAVEAEEGIAPVVAPEPIEEVAVEEVPVAPIEEVVEVAVEEVIAPIEEVVEDDAHAEIMKALIERIEALEAKLASAGEFEALATEAIDTLARSTSSAFKPEARKVATVNENTSSKGGSIFQRMRNK